MTNSWVHHGFEEFVRGQFDNGGDNLYVNARGEIETIHRFDVNDDGCVDIAFPNAHGYLERGPTWIYSIPDEAGRKDGSQSGQWTRQELANDSGWMSRVMDVDGDGYADLIVVNGENGVTSELDSYVYWGGPEGLTGERTELPTVGAYDVAALDLRGTGRLDLIFPSAWVDHHNPGLPRLVQVYEQSGPRRFADESERYGIEGVAALGLLCEDLTGNGRPDLVVANYRADFEYDTDSFLYPGTESGFQNMPIRLPTHFALQVISGDLNGDGLKEIVFSGGDQIYIYWNRAGQFRPDDRQILDAEGNSTMFAKGSVRTAVADVDGDGRNELMVVTRSGIEIRDPDDLASVRQLLMMEYSGWVEAVDVDGDGWLDLVASSYQDGRDYETNSAVFWNGPDGLADDRVTWLPTAGAVGATAGDLDGDGKAEVVFNNTMGGPSQFNPDFPFYIYLGNEAGEYDASRRLELPTGGGTNTHVLADFDQDGFVDLAFVSPDGTRVFHGGPDGLRPENFTVLPRHCPMTHYILAGDFNKDGWLDLLVVGYTYDDKPETLAHSTILYYGSADGFSPDNASPIPTYCGGSGQVADLNRNGWLDFITYDKRGYLAVFLGGPEGFSEDRMWKIQLDSETGGAPSGIVGITCADLTGNGYVDLLCSVMGHYTRVESGVIILYGGPEGYSAERMAFHESDASPIAVSVADLNRNGHLDLLVPAYSTRFTRELPAHIYWGSQDGFDWENPTVIPCDSSCAFLVVDVTGNNYPDLLAICHRNDLGHQVDSLLFRNGPEGLSFDQPDRLPGLGPHLSASRDFGNAFTREPVENYISPPYATEGHAVDRLSWQARTPDNTQLRFQLRSAETKAELEVAEWLGPDGRGSFYDSSGTRVPGSGHGGRWLQYKATFVHTNGCRSPQLNEVRVDFTTG